MKKIRNICLKSMLRQRLRTLLLVLLIAAASFAFVLRTVEYIVVHDQIMEMSETYQTIGFIEPVEGGNHTNIAHVADILYTSEHVMFEDRRMTFEGVLQGMNNIDFMGMQAGLDAADQLSITDVYFYATILELWDSPWAGQEWPWVHIDTIYAGYEEHANLNLRVWVLLDTHELGRESFDMLEVGERFFFRARYYMQWGTFGPLTPQIGRGDVLTLLPVNEDAGITIIPVAEGESIDLDAPEFAHITEYMESASRDHRTTQVTGTHDLQASPAFAGNHAQLRMIHGRAIDGDDNAEQNHVANISTRFANLRNIEIGDTIEIAIYPEQFVDGIAHGFGRPLVRSVPEGEPYMLSVEVVGIFAYFPPGGMFSTIIPTGIYVPASILPEGMTLSPPHRDIAWADYDNYLAAGWYNFALADAAHEQEFLAWFWEHPELFDYNVVIIGDGGDALNFQASAQPVLLAILFNAVIFWAVLILVMALVAFIFVRQRQRDIAIYRALGASKLVVMWHMLKTALIFVVPSAVAGSIAGWFLALRAAATVLEPFAVFMQEPAGLVHPLLRQPPPQVIEFDLELGAYWLIGLAGFVVVLLMVMVLCGTLRILGASVLALLQGYSSRGGTKKVTVAATDGEQEALAISGLASQELDIPTSPPVVFYGARRDAAIRFINRHILRSPIKSMLGLVIALAFVAALGWLQESMVRSDNEVDRLYATTIVHGQMGTNLPGAEISASVTNFFAPGFLINDVIRPQMVGVVQELAGQTDVVFWGEVEGAEHVYITNLYLESGFIRSFFVHSPDGGGLQENWQEITGIDQDEGLFANFSLFDRLFAFNDIDRFVSENTDHRGVVEFEFGAGFEIADFTGFEVGGRIPVIISQESLESNGLSVGDYINIGYFTLTISSYSYVPAQIIGVHNGHILRDDMEYASLIPLSALEDMLGNLMGYITLAFEVDTIHNREIVHIRDTLQEVANTQRGHLNLTMSLFLQDEELRNVANALEQTMLLLELLYPVAIIMSIVIAMGLSMLLMLQTARNAAIMRVLGAPKQKTRTMLAVEMLLVCLVGLAASSLVFIVMGWGFGIQSIASIAGMYFGGALIGAAAGAYMVTKRPPLELLQVRE
ncbi:MAG: ABC transporter permease [Defluviitaleaceae bacterium]|nr:ABC transporter permease [Defluviitaleaceae bacterium]